MQSYRRALKNSWTFWKIRRICPSFWCTTTSSTEKRNSPKSKRSCAILIGFGVAFLIQPGDYIDSSQISLVKDNGGQETEAANQPLVIQNLPEKIVNILPDNPLEAMVTGEPIPVEKHQGDSVIGATVNGTGSLVMEI